ncbi:MAG: hypothetical protein ACM3U2_07895 [Deltaproteobacteria bacterium]
MPSKIAPLHVHLAALRRQRWGLRVMRGAMALAVLLLLALALDFLVDWLFVFSRPQRGLLLAVLGCVALWGFRRFIWPAVVARETDIDLALLVERQQGIDSDLVAALQFESPQARAWGSVELEEAVVDYVAEFGNSLKVKRGLAGTDIRRTALALGATVGAVCLTAALFPNHAAVFLNRLLLGSAHYPTDTRITRITVNGDGVDLANPGARPTRVPFGAVVRFEVESSGVLPDAGEIRVIARTGGAATTLILAPSEQSSDTMKASAGQESTTGESGGAKPAASGERGVYTADLARLVEEISYQVFLGDAWTEPASIQVISPPVVSLELNHTPPAYAARAAAPRASASSRQLSVIEGSQVALTIRCGNKPLAKVELVTGEARYRLEPHDPEKHVWKLPATGTPLSRVTGPVPFEVEAVDDDGLSPDQPLRGHIRIEADRPPRIAAAVVTEKVLPAARPGIAWGAADDYGLAEVRLLGQVTRQNGEIEQTIDVVQKVPAQEQPQTALRGRYVLDLAPLSLSRGDQVRVTLEAVDYRDEQPGMTAQSEPVVFQVTDESGILAGLIEADQKSARQLDQIIQRQLGIGEPR